MFLVAASFLLLSGIAALTYQVVWVRLLGLSMGSTSAAISTVLAAFFLGLALGSFLAERITRNRIDNLRPYIWLELVIGVSGLLLLPLLLNLDSLMAGLPVWGTSLTMKFVVTTALLILPTLCMGATFPVMAGIMIRHHGEVGLRMSQLYSLNTAGAVLGAGLSGFLFIPLVGLDGSVYIAASLNLLIVFLAWRFDRSLRLPPVQEAQADDDDTQTGAAPLRGRALLVLAVTGFVAIATEVGWTKYLVLFAGTTIYGFAAILTIFLIGIASGSWVIRHHMERMKQPQAWMAVGLVLLGLSLLLTRVGLSAVPAVYSGINFITAPDWVIHLIKYGLILLLLFPPTFVFGALFPINLRLYCGDLSGVRSRIGRAYAVNTVASIAGSILAGFWVIPNYGTDPLLTILALMVLVLPLVFLPVLATPRLRGALAAGIVVVFAGNWLLPHLNYERLVLSVGYDWQSRNQQEAEFMYLKEGKAGVISMLTFDGRHVKLQNNGLNESVVDLQDYHHLLVSEALLGLMPYFYHPEPKSAFVVGFGGGITTRALSFSQLESIRVVELEEAVVDAGREIYGGELKVLEDPRVTLTINDARNTLLVEDTSYDIIVAQPSHPWRAGAANVFTQEFFHIVHSRLNEGGIFGQWINLFNMDKTTLRALIRGFVDVFPHVVSYASLDTGDLMLYGSDEPLVFDRKRVEQRFAEEDISKVFAHFDVYDPDHLFWYFALSREELDQATAGSIANTDTNILSEVRLSRMVRAPEEDEDPYKFLQDNYNLDMASYLESEGRARRYYDAVNYFFDYNADEYADRIVASLERTDPLYGRSLKYRTLVHQVRLDEAAALYAGHDQWLDEVHEHQALWLAESEQWQQAHARAAAIVDPVWRQLVQARLWYGQKQWSKLRQLPQTDYRYRIWRLAARAQQDLRGAGKGLHELMNDDIQVPELMRLMIRYYGEIGDTKNMDHYVRRLAAQTDKQVQHLYDQAQRFKEDGDIEQGRRILQRMQALYPDLQQTRQLEQELDTDISNEFFAVKN